MNSRRRTSRRLLYLGAGLVVAGMFCMMAAAAAVVWAAGQGGVGAGAAAVLKALVYAGPAAAGLGMILMAGYVVARFRKPHQRD